MSETGASDELIEVVFAALDHGIGSVSISGGPLIPFTLTEDGAGRHLARFVAETLEESLIQARTQVAASDADRVAIAHDGYLTVEGERSDAIFVEAQDRGSPSCLVFAQRYRPGGRLRKLSRIGNPALTGTGDPLF